MTGGARRQHAGRSVAAPHRAPFPQQREPHPVEQGGWARSAYDGPRLEPSTLAQRYLAELGVRAAAPSITGLVELHRAHVQRFAHDTIWISRDRQPPPEDLEVAEHLLAGEGGACIHLNWSFAWLLTHLGYDVTRHRALTQSPFEPAPHDDDGGHCALTVALDGARWYVDVGLGNGMIEPMPLAEGDVTQDGGFTYRLERRVDGPVPTWRFLHDRHVRALSVVEFVDEPVPPHVVLPLYTRATRWSGSPFVQNLTANRRLPEEVLMLTNGTFLRRNADGRTVTRLEDARAWETCLREEFLLRLPSWSTAERDRLWVKASEG